MLLGDTLERVRILAEGLVLKPERMRANLDLTEGLIMAEPIMLALGKYIGRQEAHDVVYDAAQAAALGNDGFAQLLAADARVGEHLSAGEIDTLLDPTRYTGLCAELARTQAVRARALAGELGA